MKTCKNCDGLIPEVGDMSFSGRPCECGHKQSTSCTHQFIVTEWEEGEVRQEKISDRRSWSIKGLKATQLTCSLCLEKKDL